MEYQESFVVGKGIENKGLHIRPSEAITYLCLEVIENVEIFLKNKTNNLETQVTTSYDVTYLSGFPENNIEVTAKYEEDPYKEEAIETVKKIGEIIKCPEGDLVKEIIYSVD